MGIQLTLDEGEAIGIFSNDDGAIHLHVEKKDNSLVMVVGSQHAPHKISFAMSSQDVADFARVFVEITNTMKGQRRR